METNPSIIAREYRLTEWAEMIRECQNRPENVTVKEWCNNHHLTKATYYYRLQQVRRACLDSLPVETSGQKVVAVPGNLLPDQETSKSILSLTIHGAQIHVTNETSSELLKMVLEVLAHVE